jgi:ABC-type antimicrobial peptide transport system permease subunit
LKARPALVLRDVWQGIWSRPGRAGLSFLAIAVGIASLCILIAALSGLSERSRRMVAELGADVIGIFPHAEARRSPAFGLLQQKHAQLLAANLGGSPVSTVRQYKVPTLGTHEVVTVVGTNSALAGVRQWRLEAGRFLDERDLERGERNAVVSEALRTRWNWGVGHIVLLRDVPFRVVGVVSLGSGALDSELADPALALGERVVFVPRSVVPYWVTEARAPDDGVDGIFVRVSGAQTIDSALRTSQRLLAQPDQEVKQLSWVTPQSITRRVQQLQNVIALTLGSITVLCLVLGGTTLMSLMVANVRERVTEIGLRRSLGASASDVAALFVLEACVVTVGAALLATAGTNLLLVALKNVLPIPVMLGAGTLLVPPLLAAAMGAAFSYWPARSAARISPSEALRNE